MFDQLRKILKKDKQKPKIIIFAGAGLSAESGLATFRNSPTGLWNQYKISEVCDLRTWKQNKDLVNQFYSERKKEILAANPNAAHLSIAQLQQELGHENVQVFTSNIDDLLERAGTKTTHIHGDIYHAHCQDCQTIWNIGTADFTSNNHCPKCSSGNIKPGIIFFHEPAPKYYEMQQSFESSGIIKNQEVIPNIRLIIGTSFKVLPLERFYLTRGINFLVDPLPQISNRTDLFQQIWDEPASTGTAKALISIKNLYQQY